MGTFIVGITEDGKWHCFQTDIEPRMLSLVGGQRYYDKDASRGAEALMTGSSNPWHETKDRYVFTCACHAMNSYQAIKLCKGYYGRLLLHGATDA